jgi:hypothetical protein
MQMIASHLHNLNPSFVLRMPMLLRESTLSFSRTMPYSKYSAFLSDLRNFKKNS